MSRSLSPRPITWREFVRFAKIPVRLMLPNCPSCDIPFVAPARSVAKDLCRCRRFAEPCVLIMFLPTAQAAEAGFCRRSRSSYMPCRMGPQGRCCTASSVPRVTSASRTTLIQRRTPGRTGSAHFFEHMMFRGTKNVPNYDIPLQETGGQSNAFTSEDATVYYETVPTSSWNAPVSRSRAARTPTLGTGAGRNSTPNARLSRTSRQSIETVPYGLAEETLLAHVFRKDILIPGRSLARWTTSIGRA